MTPAIIVVVVLLAVLAIVLIRQINGGRRIKELAEKISFSVKSPRVMKLTFEDESALGEIASGFNTLVDSHLELLGENKELIETQKEKSNLDSKVAEFEESLNQTALLTDIGKQITANLDINSIVRIVHENIKSSMDVDELELLYYKNNEPILIHVDSKNAINKHGTEHYNQSNPLMRWCIDNDRTVQLDDAEGDYAQYVSDPITSISGNTLGSIICVPLSVHNASIGAVAVSSKQKSVYNKYHVEFIKSLGSYMSVALDNSNIYEQLNTSKEIIETEKAKSEDLLLNILPVEIAEELKQHGEAKARTYDNVSILFTDFKRFTETSEKLTAEQLVDELNHYFKGFDDICDRYGIEKIKTIGDSFMAVGGMPIPSDQAVVNIVKAGLDMLDFVEKRTEEIKGTNMIPFQMRVGINSGPVVAGIVGSKKFQYDIWGDAVNVASRMESNGEVGRLNVSLATYNLIKDNPSFTFEHRGKVAAKGKGEIDMYFVNRA